MQALPPKPGHYDSVIGQNAHQLKENSFLHVHRPMNSVNTKSKINVPSSTKLGGPGPALLRSHQIIVSKQYAEVLLLHGKSAIAAPTSSMR